MMFLFCLTICLCFIYNRVKKYSEFLKFAKEIGGPRGYPIVGNALDFIQHVNDTLNTLENYVNHFGDRLVFFLGFQPVLLINNANDIEKVCTSPETISKSEDYELAWNWLGQGLVTSSGSHWEHRRKLITPCFSFKTLEDFVAPINIKASILVDQIAENLLENQGLLDVRHFIVKCTLDIICETSIRIQIDAQKLSNCAHVQATNRLAEIFSYRMVRPWLHSKYIWKLKAKGREERKLIQFVHATADKAINNRKIAIMNQKKFFDQTVCRVERYNVKKPLLDFLLEAQRTNPMTISNQGIREEVNTFLFAGHDTVSVTVSFCLYNLANNINAQKKLHLELDTILGKGGNKEVTSADLRNLKYLELCIKESLRLFPSVPLLARKVTKPLRLDDNTLVPRGVLIYICLYTLHRNAKYFKEPTRYIPERFDLENVEWAEYRVKCPFSFIPFSAGARNCIGQKMAMMETKIILAKILTRFKVTCEQNGGKLDIRPEIVLRVQGEMNLKFKERKKTLAKNQFDRSIFKHLN